MRPIPQERASVKAGNRLGRWVKGGLLLGISVLMAAGIGEITLRFLAPQVLTGVLYQSDPYMAYRLRPNLDSFQVINGHKVPIRTDSNGLRILPPPSRSNLPRVLCVGASDTFGWGVASADSYLGWLQRFFPDYEFLNASVPGYSLVQMLSFLENRGLELKPSYVIILPGANDVGQNWLQTDQQGLSGDARHLVKFDSQAGLRRIDFFLYRWLAERSHLVALLRKSTATILARFNVSAKKDAERELGKLPDLARKSEEAEAFRLTETLYRMLDQWSLKTRVPVLVVPVGEPDKLDRGFIEKSLRTLKTSSLRVLVVKGFDESSPSLRIPDDPHWNEQGHRQLAENLKKPLGEWLKSAAPAAYSGTRR